MPLAITTFEKLKTLTDEKYILNLAWTLDERELLSKNLDQLLSTELKEEALHLHYLHRYFVDDPYGEMALRPSIENFFSLTNAPYSITCGAGVISLLYCLAHMNKQSPTYIMGEIYPDYIHWLTQHGIPYIRGAHSLSMEEHIENVSLSKAAVIFLEHPSFFESSWANIEHIKLICTAAVKQNAIVIIDESNANYYPPDFSAIHLLNEVDNLIIIRGFSKGYGMGSLRLSYCIYPPKIQSIIREHIPPLLASSLSIKLGKMLLDLGDIFQNLRAIIARNKLEMVKILKQSDIKKLVLPSKGLPYVLIHANEDYVKKHIESRGIIGKYYTNTLFSPLYRLSVPLFEDRMKLFKTYIK